MYIEFSWRRMMPLLTQTAKYFVANPLVNEIATALIVTTLTIILKKINK